MTAWREGKGDSPVPYWGLLGRREGEGTCVKGFAQAWLLSIMPVVPDMMGKQASQEDSRVELFCGRSYYWPDKSLEIPFWGEKRGQGFFSLRFLDICLFVYTPAMGWTSVLLLYKELAPCMAVSGDGALWRARKIKCGHNGGAVI